LLRVWGGEQTVDYFLWNAPIRMFIFYEFGRGVSGIVFVFIQLCDDQGTKAREITQEKTGSRMPVLLVVPNF
jgi:hypothetical protein